MGRTIKLYVQIRVTSGAYRNLAHCFVDTGKTLEEKAAMTEEAWEKHIASVKRKWVAKSVKTEWKEANPYERP